MAEMRLMGTKKMLEEMVPVSAQETLGIEIKGGDTRVMWNPRDRDEARAAENTFRELTRNRFLAFRVDDEGGQGERIREFDPEAGKLILAPPMAGG